MSASGVNKRPLPAARDQRSLVGQMAPVTTLECSSKSHSTFRQAELTAGRLSVPIRRALREELAEWTRLVNDTGDRGPSKNPAAVGENSRKSIADWMHPIRVEKRWGGGTIRQGEGATGRPRLRRELFFEPSIRNVQHLPGIGDAFGIALGLRSHSIRDQRLHRTHDVVVKEPIDEAHR